MAITGRTTGLVGRESTERVCSAMSSRLVVSSYPPKSGFPQLVPFGYKERMQSNEGPLTGIDEEPVSQWLQDNIPGASGPFTFELIIGGHSNLTYRVSGADGDIRARRDMVLRRPPLGAVLATAHDMSREHRIISGVGRSNVPVPTALGMCDDESVNGAPFYVMDYIEGVVLHDEETATRDLPDHGVRAAACESLVDALAELHTADPASIGLGELGRVDGYLDRQLKRWNTQWEKSKTRELPAMTEAHRRLVEAKPEQRYAGIVHGDYRFGNMLIEPGKGSVAAVLDWELCTLGDVLADIGYLLNNWAEPGEEAVRGATSFPTQAGGFWSREKVVAEYCHRTGFDFDHVTSNQGYYQAFQYWRLAAIVEGVLARYLKGVMADSSVDTDLYRVQVEEMANAALELT